MISEFRLPGLRLRGGAKSSVFTEWFVAAAQLVPLRANHMQKWGNLVTSAWLICEPVYL